MTAEPEGKATAAATGHHLRASHADRERVIDILKAAFVHGLVTKDEFDARVGLAFASRTGAGLAEVTADLPAGLIGNRPPRTAAQAQGRPPMSHSDKARRSMVIAIALMTVAVLVPGGPAIGLFAPLCFAAWMVAGAQLLASRDGDGQRRGMRSAPKSARMSSRPPSAST